ncbi:MAG: hypothetical protein FK731_08020 [Asgard group archaeon]|nr:hypothetical protein [Asgard group archaeon]
MMSNFPQKYFFIFANSPNSKIHHNNMNAGLRLALTLLMDEYVVYVLLTEEAIFLVKKQGNNEQQTLDQFSESQQNKQNQEDDVSFTPYELIEGIISFGGRVLTCKSSLALTGLKEEDIIEGVEILHLQNAVKIMIECTETLVF